MRRKATYLTLFRNLSQTSGLKTRRTDDGDVHADHWAPRPCRPDGKKKPIHKIRTVIPLDNKEPICVPGSSYNSVTATPSYMWYLRFVIFHQGWKIKTQSSNKHDLINRTMKTTPPSQASTVDDFYPHMTEI
jgi:hypothetical protein